jgi:hypothetical protein
MKLRLRNQEARLVAALPEMIRRPLNFDDIDRLRPQCQAAELPLAVEDLRKLNLGFLYRYHIFPPSILRFASQWEAEQREMREGDVIVLQAQVPPGCGVRLIFGVRVMKKWHQRTSAGFTYGTLQGHPERGINTFSFSLEGSLLTASITTRAGAGTLLSRTLAPVFTFPYARHANRAALNTMIDRFCYANDLPGPGESAIQWKIKT